MSLRVIFLGTSGSIPTANRGLPAIAIKRKEELLILDCGEGTQRQMIQGGVGFHRKTKVFLTHMHGDHIFGLPGLIQTMSLLRREKKLEIYGPLGIEAFVEAIAQTVQFRLSFPITVSEITNPGILCKEKEYHLHAVSSNHVIPGFAFALIENPRPGKFHPKKAEALEIPQGPLWSRLQAGSPIELADGRIIMPEDVLGSPRPGRKIVYSGDTRPTEELKELARKADLLIHEATFEDSLEERAKRDGHCTPTQAATLAANAGVKRLVLTHISARYKDADLLLRQARKVFPQTEVAEDFSRIDLTLKDAE